MSDNWRDQDRGQPPPPKDDDGCKDCCSLIMGAFSLTGLVAVLVPMLLYQLKKGLNDGP